MQDLLLELGLGIDRFALLVVLDDMKTLFEFLHGRQEVIRQCLCLLSPFVSVDLNCFQSVLHGGHRIAKVLYFSYYDLIGIGILAM